MKKLLLALFVFSFSLCEGQSWDWGTAVYGSIDDNLSSCPVAVDNAGNAYITGEYTGSVVFNSTSLVNPVYNKYTGQPSNAYLVKYNPSGNVVWAIQPVDSDQHSGSNGCSVATDHNGNIYVAGNFGGAVTFGNIKLRGGGIFLVKYSSEGNVIWARQSTVAKYFSGYNYSLATDKFGNVFFAGNFYDTITFGKYLIIPMGYIDVPNFFLVKYDSHGNLLWAKQDSSLMEFSQVWGASVTCDNYGNAFITGGFQDVVSFGPYVLSNLNETTNNDYSWCTFIAKYSPSGNVLWAKQSTNFSLRSSASGCSVVTDESDNAYITGTFSDTVSFGTHTLYSPKASSAFICKYNGKGSLIWARQTSPGWYGYGLASDKMNDIYMQGENYFTQSHALTYYNFSLSSPPWVQCTSFLIKLDTAGYPICGSLLDGLGDGGWGGGGVASDPTGQYVYETGLFTDTIKCASDILTGNSNGFSIFLGRWLSTDANPIPVSELLVYPNPTNGTFAATGELPGQLICIYNNLGQKIMSVTANSTYMQFDLSAYSKGIYTVVAYNFDGSEEKYAKIVKVK